MRKFALTVFGYALPIATVGFIGFTSVQLVHWVADIHDCKSRANFLLKTGELNEDQASMFFYGCKVSKGRA